MTQRYCRVAVKSPRQRHCQHDSAALPPACLSIYFTPWPSHLGSAIACMTRHLHRAAAKSPRQWHRQHDSASTSHRGQVAPTAPWPAWPSLAWLGIYIAPQPSRLGSVVASMTQHLHRVAAKLPWQHRRQHGSTAPSLAYLVSTSHHGQVASAAPSPAWLDNDIAPWPTSSR
jgi:hypothetical protein